MQYPPGDTGFFINVPQNFIARFWIGFGPYYSTKSGKDRPYHQPALSFYCCRCFRRKFVHLFLHRLEYVSPGFYGMRHDVFSWD